MPDSGICRQSLNKYAIAVPSLFLSMSKKVRSRFQILLLYNIHLSKMLHQRSVGFAAKNRILRTGKL